MSEFWAGVRTLLEGFGWWRRDPRVMAAALIPAAIVGAAMAAALITLGALLPAIAEGLTPWAEDWAAIWTILVRVLIGAAVLAGGLVVAVTTFTALTLLVGEPFYDRVWRSVEAARTGSVPESAHGFWRSVADSASLIARGLAIAVASVALGFVPVVGAPLAAVVGAALSGWVLSDELSARALSARGIGAQERRALRRGSRARVAGFGMATHVCLLVPLGAIVAMPAAVAGSTLLAHTLLERRSAQSSSARG
ncbi:EI24 domain-containing protein [Microbacterium sp. KNMS]